MRKLKIRTTLATLSLMLLGLLNAIPAQAAQFTLLPGSGAVVEGAEFTIDILIDTEGDEVVLARSVLTFDPSRVQLIRAERNNSIFEQYPTNGSTIDNTNGVAMLEGFTQSGSSALYQTVGEPDVFVRLRFEATRSGAALFDWEYSGSDQPFKSVILVDGSPPQNELASKPSNLTVNIQGASTSTDGGTTGGTTPITGSNDYTTAYISLGIILGSIMVFAGGKILSDHGHKLWGKKRTVVEYD